MPLEHGPALETPDADSGPGAPDLRDLAGSPPAELWSWLPRLASRQVRLEASLACWTGAGRALDWLGWNLESLDEDLELGRPEILWRASGLRRPGLIAQLRATALHTRLAVGVEVAVAHAIVDRLLGHNRPFAESRLQLTPVEWGVWTYLLLRALETLDLKYGGARARAGAPPRTGSSELLLDRVGPDPFDPADLGAIVTVRVLVRVGTTKGTAWLWIPESALGALSAWERPTSKSTPAPGTSKAGALSSHWRAVAGFVAMPDGLKRLRRGGVLPLIDSRLRGTPRSPSGPITLECGPGASGERFEITAEPVEDAAGRQLKITGPLTCHIEPREPLTPGTNQAMSSGPSPAANPSPGAGPSSAAAPAPTPLDVPVTLTVELGRVNLTLSRLADLKPGDVVELGRHSREPVELTSSGRLVARGELVLIDTELGVRVTNVFL